MKIHISVGDDDVEFEVPDEMMSDLKDGKDVGENFWKMYFQPSISFLVQNLKEE